MRGFDDADLSSLVEKEWASFRDKKCKADPAAEAEEAITTLRGMFGEDNQMRHKKALGKKNALVRNTGVGSSFKELSFSSDKLVLSSLTCGRGRVLSKGILLKWEVDVLCATTCIYSCRMKPLAGFSSPYAAKGPIVHSDG